MQFKDVAERNSAAAARELQVGRWATRVGARGVAGRRSGRNGQWLVPSVGTLQTRMLAHKTARLPNALEPAGNCPNHGNATTAR